MLAGRTPPAGGGSGAVVSRHPPPGACLAVSAPGLSAVAVAGHRQVLGVPVPLPLTPGTSHDLASVTKIVASVGSLMTLVAAGALGLDDPVHRYVGGFREGDKAQVTVSDLLLHRAGLWEWWPVYCEALTVEGAYRFVEGLTLRYPARSGRRYSDLGFMVLGRIVEVVGGGPLARVVQALVLEPAGMVRTAFGAPPGRAAAVPTGAAPDVAASSSGDTAEWAMLASGQPYPVPYRPSAFPGWRRYVLVGEVNDGNSFHAFGGQAGHAGLFSTVHDLVRLGNGWCASLRGEGPWPAQVVTRFVSSGPDPGQALGFRSWSSTVGSCTATVYGHPGFTGTTMGILPTHQAVVVLATNRLHVAGTPTPNEPMWEVALAAAHRALHQGGV